MNTLEKKLLDKLDNNFLAVVFLAVSALGFALRFSLRGIVSVDANDWLLPWFEAIAEKGLSEQVGNYNLLYQFLIWVMTKLSLSPLLAYKSLSCIFDYFLAGISAMLVYRTASKNKIWSAVWTYTAVILCPTVFLNSSAWAQCDAMFVSFAVLGLYFLEKEKYNFALVSLGLSFALKLQAVFILPAYLLVYFVRRKFSIIRFALVPVSMLAASFPALLWGKNLFDVFKIYLEQTSTYNKMAMNYPSFWTFLCYTRYDAQYEQLKNMAIIFTVCVLAFIMLLWVRGKYITSGKNLIILAFVLAYACVLFLPAMHDRYGYIYEICALILAVLVPKTIPLCLGLILLSVNTYGVFLFEIPVNYSILSLANLVLFFAYIFVLKPHLEKSECPVSNG